MFENDEKYWLTTSADIGFFFPFAGEVDVDFLLVMNPFVKA